MRLKLLVFSFFIGLTAVNAQQYTAKVDSLLKKTDLIQNNPDSLKYLYNYAIQIASAERDTQLLLTIWPHKAYLYYQIGEYRNAINLYSFLKAYYQKKDDSLSVGWNGYMIGISYKYWGKYHEAQREIQENIKLFEKLKSESGVLSCYIVSGYINQAWGNYAEVERICNSTLKMAEQQSNKSAQAFSLLALGNACASKNQFDSAYVFFQKASRLFYQENDSYGIALAERDLGNFYIQKRETTNALKYLQNSLKILESLSENRGISEVLALIGKVHFYKSDYETSIKYFDKSQRLAVGMELYEDIIRNLKDISEVYQKLGKYDIALSYQLKYSSLKDSIFNAEKHLQIADLQTQYESEKKEQQIAIQNIQLEKNQSIQRLLVLAIVLALALAFFSFRWYRIKKQDNLLLSQQKMVIEQKNTQITDSINYARKIQGALLAKSSSLVSPIKEFFIFYNPKDIVSGDFYYIKEFENYTVIAAADCTGHGVPGAFMSMLSISMLHEIFIHSKPSTAAQVLEELRIKIKDALNQTEFKTETKDGLDIALCLINKHGNQLQFSGAYNPLYQIRNNELIEYRATRNPVGIHLKESPFINEIVSIQPNDIFYIFSDGFYDQIGSSTTQKFKVLEYKKLLISISSKPMNEQRGILESTITQWRGSVDQTDDMLIIGFKV